MDEPRLLDLTSFKLVGCGGESLVFLCPDGQAVVKVNYLSIPLIREDRERMAARVESKNAEVSLFMQHFGAHFPDTAYQISVVRISMGQLNGYELPSDQVRQYLGVSMDSGTDEIKLEAVIANQTAIQLEQYQVSMFSIGSHDPLKKEALARRMAGDFRCVAEAGHPEALIAEFYPCLQALVAKAKAIPAFFEALQDFVARLIRFTTMTGKAIDLEGRDNIFFLEKGGAIDCLLLDVLQSEPTNYSEHMAIFAQKRLGERPGSNIDEIVLNELCQLWAMNLLAAVLQMDDRVDGFARGASGEEDSKAQLAQFVREVTAGI